MVDAMDSKSVVLTDVWVRVPLPVLTDNRRGPNEPTEWAGRTGASPPRGKRAVVAAAPFSYGT
jgi:hypothetical protein